MRFPSNPRPNRASHRATVVVSLGLLSVAGGCARTNSRPEPDSAPSVQPSRADSDPTPAVDPTPQTSPAVPRTGTVDVNDDTVEAPVFVLSPHSDPAPPLRLLRPFQLPPSARHVLGDFDGDGQCDGLVDPSAGPAMLVEYSAERLARSLPVYIPQPGGARRVPLDPAAWVYGARMEMIDLDGDGHRDLVVGNPGIDEYGELARDSGGWAVFSGGSSGIDSSGVAYAGGSPGLGARVQNVGDFNGDGAHDIAISDPDAENGSGRVYIVLGGSSALPATFDITAPSPRVVRLTGEPTTTSRDWEDAYPFDGMHFGASLTAAGDVDGDGLADLVVGFSGFEEHGLEVVFGSRTLSDAAGVRLSAPARPYPHPPTLVPVSGRFDLDGDAHADLVFGLRLGIQGDEPTSRLVVVYGGPHLRRWPASVSLETLESQDRVRSWGPPTGADTEYFAIALAPAIDLDGDQRSEVVAFGRLHRSGESDKGARNVAWVLSGANLGDLKDLSNIGSPAGREHGWLLKLGDGGAAPPASSVCDISGDGRPDLLIGQSDQDYVHHRATKLVGIRGR